jgi:hypothetical protein
MLLYYPSNKKVGLTMGSMQIIVIGKRKRIRVAEDRKSSKHKLNLFIRTRKFQKKKKTKQRYSRTEAAGNWIIKVPFTSEEYEH